MQKLTSRVKRSEIGTDYLSSPAYGRKTNPVTKDFLVQGDPTVDLFKYIKKINNKAVKIRILRLRQCIFAFKFDDFEGRYLENKLGTVSISFHFLCRTSKCTRVQIYIYIGAEAEVCGFETYLRQFSTSLFLYFIIFPMYLYQK